MENMNKKWFKSPSKREMRLPKEPLRHDSSAIMALLVS